MISFDKSRSRHLYSFWRCENVTDHQPNGLSVRRNVTDLLELSHCILDLLSSLVIILFLVLHALIVVLQLNCLFW